MPIKSKCTVTAFNLNLVYSLKVYVHFLDMLSICTNVVHCKDFLLWCRVHKSGIKYWLGAMCWLLHMMILVNIRKITIITYIAYEAVA